MKIIILAAGKGTRLWPLTRNTPKPLIDLGNGETLLERQVSAIEESGVIDKVVIVIGYLHGQIESKMKTFQTKLKVKTVYNPFFESSNNLISLWFAKHEMKDDDFLITNGDNLFTADVLRDIVKKTNDGIYLTVCYADEYGEDDMKVKIDENKKIIRVSKLIEKGQGDGESVGLVKVQGETYRKIYTKVLEKLARKEEYLNKFWLETFNRLSEKCVDIIPFEIDREKWREVDFHFDLNKLKDLVKDFKI